ncbi:hypothetical protein FRB98_002563 [Tulasnella sp. 332]|nr:hypothetical protein FRB98_002563 [Tulasnella sp. 332]
MNQGQDQIQTIPLEQPRPTFADFIKWAILRSPRQRATAEEICEAVSARYPFYQDPVQFKFLKAGVKHRTSRLPQFKLTGAKPAGQTAKGNYWIYVAELDRSAKRSPLDPFNDMSGSLTLMAGPTATTEGDTGIDTGTSTQGLTSILEAALASVSLEAPLASASLSENIPGCPGNRDLAAWVYFARRVKKKSHDTLTSMEPLHTLPAPHGSTVV